MKNHNLRIYLKSGRIEKIYHVDNFYFFEDEIIIKSYGLETRIKTWKIDLIETFSSHY